MTLKAVDQEPMGQEPVDQESVDQKPVDQEAVDQEALDQKPPTITSQPHFHVTYTQSLQKDAHLTLNMPIQDSQDYAGVFKVLAKTSRHHCVAVGSVRDMAQVILA